MEIGWWVTNRSLDSIEVKPSWLLLTFPIYVNNNNNSKGNRKFCMHIPIDKIPKWSDWLILWWCQFLILFQILSNFSSIFVNWQNIFNRYICLHFALTSSKFEKKIVLLTSSEIIGTKISQISQKPSKLLFWKGFFLKCFGAKHMVRDVVETTYLIIFFKGKTIILPII